jgi:hypothetical protein
MTSLPRNRKSEYLQTTSILRHSTHKLFLFPSSRLFPHTHSSLATSPLVNTMKTFVSFITALSVAGQALAQTPAGFSPGSDTRLPAQIGGVSMEAGTYVPLTLSCLLVSLSIPATRDTN